MVAHLPPLQLFNANYLESKQSKNLFQPFPFSLTEKLWFSKNPYFWPCSQQITDVVHQNYVHCIFHWHPFFRFHLSIHFHLFFLKPLQPPFTFIFTFTFHPLPHFFPGRSSFTFSTFTFTFSTFWIPLHISIVIVLLPWPGFTSQLSILNPILPAANSSNIGAAPE